MKQSELNHLRRLLGWVKCEIGQEPEAMVAMLGDIADKLGNPPLTDDAKQRLVEGYDKSQRVPKYIREAVKALEKLTGPGEDIGDAEPTLRKLERAPDHEQLRPGDGVAHIRRLRASGQ
jgi:hypothetical protein